LWKGDSAVKLIDSIRERWNHRTRFIRVDERGLKVYKCWCTIHREFYEAYPAGYNAILHCPKCLKERFEE